MYILIILILIVILNININIFSPRGDTNVARKGMENEPRALNATNLPKERNLKTTPHNLQNASEEERHRAGSKMHHPTLARQTGRARGRVNSVKE